MTKLSQTLAGLSAMRAPPEAGEDRLVDLNGFGSNPGNLRARYYQPGQRAGRAPLIAVLHGCMQTAVEYDTGSGWSRLADEEGFVLLYPEQRRANNPNLCFNWYDPANNHRDAGEALSIWQMIAAMIRDHTIDADRVFVTGLSAGGAMAAVMLATYPEIFAGGGIIAGLPYGCATNVPEALGLMRGRGQMPLDDLGALIRTASSHKAPWPKVSVWHGGADLTVVPSNADAIVAQWCSVHGIDPSIGETEQIDGQERRSWRDLAGDVVIESYSIDGMGHGVPLDTQAGEAYGVVGPYMLETGISSTGRIAVFWGIADAARMDTNRRSTSDHFPTRAVAVAQSRGDHRRPAHDNAGLAAPAGVGGVIERALRTAGLMR